MLSALRAYVFSHTTSRIDVELGARLFRHLLALPLAYFQARRVGDSVARVRELENIRSFLTGNALTLVLDLLFSVVAWLGEPTSVLGRDAGSNAIGVFGEDGMTGTPLDATQFGLSLKDLGLLYSIVVLTCVGLALCWLKRWPRHHLLRRAGQRGHESAVLAGKRRNLLECGGMPPSTRQWVRSVVETLLVGPMVLALVSCDLRSSPPVASNSTQPVAAKPPCDTDVAEWTEGVTLFNGEEVVVWRRAVACKGGFPDSARGRDLEFELKYEPMGVQWKAPSGLKPRSFELIDGVPHLGLYVMTGGPCRDAPTDKPLGRMMKWVDRQWIEVPMAEAPLDRALVNLYTNYWGHTAKGDAKGFIAAQGKTTGWRSSMTLKEFFAMSRNQCGIYQERVEPMPSVPRSPLGGASQPR